MSLWKQKKWFVHLLPWLLLTVALAMIFSQLQRPASLIHVWIFWAEVGALALVMTPIILTGGIDLSVGSMVALCAMILGVLWHDFHWPIALAALAALAGGTLAGSLNGLLVARGLSPLVTTLATMALFRGLALAISGGERISGLPPELLSWSHLGGVPIQFWLLLLVFAVTYITVHHSRLGRWCFAIGDNPMAARFAAVPIRTTQCLLYMASGLVAGLVAVVYTIHYQAAVPGALKGSELHAIACVVVGGTLITGGRGSVLRTVLGLAVVAHLEIGLDFLGSNFLPAEGRLIMIGTLLICVSVWNQRMNE